MAASDTTAKSVTRDAMRTSRASVSRNSSSKAAQQFAKDRRAVHEKASRQSHAIHLGILFGGLFVCLVCAVIILYPNARVYYAAWRDYSNVSAELAAVSTRNATIQTRIDNLYTEEGIEDRAREEFGWVKEGENAINVIGVEADEATSALPETVVSGSVTSDTNWALEKLDKFFGYVYKG